MKATGVDVLISAPQKGWSASPSAGLVMMSQRAIDRLEHTSSDSFAMDLKKWYTIMQTYEGGGHAYHATMPTDALRAFRDTMLETRELRLRGAAAGAMGAWQWRAQDAGGQGRRSRLPPRGLARRASWSAIPTIPTSRTARNSRPWACRSRRACRCNATSLRGFRTFRLGLFGLDKLYDVRRHAGAAEGGHRQGSLNAQPFAPRPICIMVRRTGASE